jgi:hypothetical protein
MCVHHVWEVWGTESPRVVVDVLLDIVGTGLARPLAIHFLTPWLKLLVLGLKIGLPRLEAFSLLLNVGGSAAGGSPAA